LKKADATDYFNKHLRPKNYLDDKPAWRMAWQVYVDQLHRDGAITDWQRENWGNPKGSE